MREIKNSESNLINLAIFYGYTLRTKYRNMAKLRNIFGDWNPPKNQFFFYGYTKRTEIRNMAKLEKDFGNWHPPQSLDFWDFFF